MGDLTYPTKTRESKVDRTDNSAISDQILLTKA